MALPPECTTPNQRRIRDLFKRAVAHCKDPANRKGLKFQQCVGQFVKDELAKMGYVPRKRKKAVKAELAIGP